MERRPGFVGPLLLLTIGFILLFNNLGLLPHGIWGSLWRFWPVILILFGIEIIARHAESSVIYYFAVFLCILVLTGTILIAWNVYPSENIIRKNLKGINLNNSYLRNKDFDFANLDYADLSNSVLNGVDMNFASMQNANLTNSSLGGANLNFADLNYAKFNNAAMSGANLNFVNLKYADLSNADLSGANLNFASLDGANMTGARMSGANHAFAGTTKSTICPDSGYGPCW